MNRTKIDWADIVWNPVTGCTKVSEGCRNCYAERMSKRLGGRCGYPKDEPFKVTLRPDKLDEPFKWKKPQRIFVNSMSDLFHDDVPDEYIFKVLQTMANAQWINGHKFIILTKRPERMKGIIMVIKDDLEEQAKPEKLPNGMMRHQMTFSFPLQNIWLGVSVEDQSTANERIPLLLETPAAVRFISAEPLLGAINLTNLDQGWRTNALTGEQSDMGRPWCDTRKLDWVIVGGESGPCARPMHPDWARSLRDQCEAVDVPFFFKQFGEWSPVGEIKQTELSNGIRSGLYRYVDINGRIASHSMMSDCLVQRVGKKIAGRELDGRTWDEVPEVKSL